MAGRRVTIGTRGSALALVKDQPYEEGNLTARLHFMRGRAFMFLIGSGASTDPEAMEVGLEEPLTMLRRKAGERVSEHIGAEHLEGRYSFTVPSRNDAGEPLFHAGTRVVLL